MKKIFLFLTSISFGLTAMAQPLAKDGDKETTIDYAKTYAETILSADLKKHLTILASDEYEGRETGTEGNRKAAAYIANYFDELGLPKIGKNKDYYQKVSFKKTGWDEITMSVKDETYRHLWTFLSFPTQNKDMMIDTKEVVYLGYGIDDPKYNDYAKAKVKGKVIMIYQGEPTNADGVSYITGSTEVSSWSLDFGKKLEVAKKHGVKAVLFIEGDLQEQLSKARRFLTSPSIALDTGAEKEEFPYANSCMIATTIAKDIMGKKYKKVIAARDQTKLTGKPKSVCLKTKLKLLQKKEEDDVLGDNVMGFIEGSDPTLKNEVVIITAHYDHLGKRGENSIYNGADDNGSGTSTVLEVAEALAEAKKNGNGPKRSILTMLVTGEEKGLLGSEFYVENPAFSIENTIANINVDMVGRVDEKYKDNPNYVYVIGSDRLSTELHEINESVNEKYTNLVLDYTYNADDDPNRYYYRSDHYNFAQKGIPAIFYFNGTHPDYHMITDTVDKINFEKMETIGRLVFHTAWELANRDKRIEVNVEGRN